MSELSQKQIDILLDVKNNRTLYTYEEFDDKFREPTHNFLFDRGLIENDYTEENMYYFLLTPLGEIEVDKYSKELASELKTNKQWKHTTLIAWIGVGISIIALIISIFKN